MLSAVFARLGAAISRHPLITIAVWVVLAATGFALAVGGVAGQSVFDRVTTGAPSVPGSQSTQAQEILTGSADTGPSITLLISGVDPGDRALATHMVQVSKDLLAIEGTTEPISPYVLPGGVGDPAAAPLLATDGHGFILDVTLRTDLTADQQDKAATAVTDRLDAVAAELRAAVPSAAAASGLVSSNDLIVKAITLQLRHDLELGEAISLPIALLVMLLVFGGFMAAAMPMAGALASIGTGLGVLLGITYLMDIDASVVNVVTLLSIGLSIDYGLLIVSRFREELQRVPDAAAPGGRHRARGTDAVRDALVITTATAGRTVAFSAITVAISISGLIVFRPEILRSIGAGAVAGVLIAVATAWWLTGCSASGAGLTTAPGWVGRSTASRVSVNTRSSCCW
jgi:RND superfamily putative drug exporter